MFNSEGPDICTATYSSLYTTRSFLCRGYHFFRTFKVSVTSYTNCLFLPKPNFPILMSSVKQKQKDMAVPVRLLHYKACFSDCWCNSSWRRLFHWKISTFSLTPAVTTNTGGHWIPPHTHSPFERSPWHVRFLWRGLVSLRPARDTFCLLLAWNCSLRKSAREGSDEFPSFCLPS